MEQSDNNITAGNPAALTAATLTQAQPQNFKAPSLLKVAAVASGFPVTSSSEFDASHSVHRCIINTNTHREGATTWCAAFNDTSQWIQVNLITPKLVTSVAL